MKETAVIVALVLLFASSHLLLSSRGRARLAARLGARRFLVAYSVVSLAFFVPLFLFSFTHLQPGPQLWARPDSETVELLLVLANAAGVVMLVAGLLSRGPAPFAGQTLEDPAGCTGSRAIRCSRARA